MKEFVAAAFEIICEVCTVLLIFLLVLGIIALFS